MEMTTPVLTTAGQQGESSNRMAFVMENKYTSLESLPTPRDSRHAHRFISHCHLLLMHCHLLLMSLQHLWARYNCMALVLDMYASPESLHISARQQGRQLYLARGPASYSGKQ